jgi:predicted ArsR family transcriptional regulator
MRYDVGARSVERGLRTQAALLRAMANRRPATPNRLAQRVLASPRSVRMHLHRLADLGLVERDRPTTGKQWAKWRLTTTGEDHVSRLSAASV